LILFAGLILYLALAAADVARERAREARCLAIVEAYGLTPENEPKGYAIVLNGCVLGLDMDPQ
jgi:hypothetical protein